MKILLINPPETAERGSLTVLGLPLGIMYLASILEKEGKKVEIFDSIACTGRLVTSDIGNNKIRMGVSWAKIGQKIRDSRPDIVGVSNHFSSQIGNAMEVARIAKKIDNKIITVVGGPHSSCRPEDFLKERNIDFVIMGEGEYSFLELVNTLEKKEKVGKISNLAFRKNGKSIINPVKQISNLDSLPFPAYHLINMENYFKICKDMGRIIIGTTNNRRISMVTSRGCPYNCIFCSIHCHMGRNWRAHSSDYVVKHIEYLMKKFKVNHISFEDDNLVLDQKRFEKILDGIIKKRIKITWDTPNGIRADRVNFDLLKKMKRAGCSSIKIGIESGDQQVLDNIVGKSLKLEKVIEVADACKKLNIPLTGFFIIGYPGEKKINIKHTLDFAYRLKKEYYADSVITIAMPLIGTRMYDLSKEKNYLVKGHNPSEFGSKDSWVIETENFDIGYLKSERNKFYKRILLLQILQILRKPSIVLRYASILRSPQNSMQILKYLTKTE